MTHIFLTCWYTGRDDPQRHQKRNASFDHIHMWYNSLVKHDLCGVLFHDCFDDEFVDRYTTDKIQFIRDDNIRNQSLSPNDYRYVKFNQYLKKNRYDLVFTTDVDTYIQQDFLPHVEPGKIYAGDEYKWPRLGDCNWVHETSGYSYLYPDFKFWDKQMLNVGIFGGDYETVMSLLSFMLQEFKRLNPDEHQMIAAGKIFAIDMPVFTHCVYTMFSDDQIVSGEPVCSRFGFYETHRQDVWFVQH